MPYLSWCEGEFPSRQLLDGDCILGRDPATCGLARPGDPGLSRRHALLFRSGERWWIRDLDSRNGTLLNGLGVGTPFGSQLEDGDEILIGDWTLHFTIRFPGLDGVNFVEGVGDLFDEVKPEPSQGLVLTRGLQLLQRATEALLRETDASALVRSLLEEALRLLGGDRGFVVTANPEGSWTTEHRIGDVEDRMGLSQSVLDYVGQHRVGVLSNAPTLDPRFSGSSSLVELVRGALMCAPMACDGQVLGILYLDRSRAAKGFTRFDLALFQAFVRLGAITLRHTQLARKAIGRAEVQGELLRIKTLHARFTERIGELLGTMGGSLRWLQAFGEASAEPGMAAMLHQVERLQFLVETGLQETLQGSPREVHATRDLEALQGMVAEAWRELLRLRGAELQLEPAPEGSVWIAGIQSAQAVIGLVEPLLMHVPRGGVVRGRWRDEPGDWALSLEFPVMTAPPAPDAWTLRALGETGIEWRWSSPTLALAFAKSVDQTADTTSLPLLGLVSEDYALLGLFESVAEAGGLSIYPLEAEPPRTPLPAFAYLVLDAKGLPDPAAAVQAFRRHPSFLTVPILVVGAQEELFPTLLAVGATDWLPDGFRWETLHNRLQVLRGHEELQRRALAAERLDTFRQMAGSLKHEINNPLAVISMQVELLERKYPEEPKLAKIGEMVERIRGLVQVLQKMRESPKGDYPDGSSILKLS
nr:FHA domain-containing protein [uncultured Holophaga sp.]